MNKNVSNKYKAINLQELHQILLDRFYVVHQFLEENNIEYFAIGGTALGAYRHKGIIPWDDDIDIGMTRENYEKFKKICNKLDEKLFYIYGFPFSKIMEHGLLKICLKGTYVPYRNLIKGADTSVHIDVFPCDFVPNDPKMQQKEWKRLWNLKVALYWKTRKKVKTWYQKIALFFIKIILSPFSCTYFVKKMHKILKKYENSDSKEICNWLGGYTFEKQRIPFDILGTPVLLKFGKGEIRVPEKIELFLEQKFGKNYMSPQDIRFDKDKFVAYIDPELIGDLK